MGQWPGIRGGALCGFAAVGVFLQIGCSSEGTVPAGDFWPDAASDSERTREDVALDPDPRDVNGITDAREDPHLGDDPTDDSTDATDPTDVSPDAPDVPNPDLPDASGDAPDMSDSQDADPPDTDRDGPAPFGCVTEVRPGHSRFLCGAGIRFDVEVPSQCLATRCGVIFDVHGLSMDADQQDRNTQMRSLGAELDYVVVQPNAPNRAWNGIEHDAPVWAFYQDVVTAYAADRSRLHFTGFSQGGDMTVRMLCAHADELASVAPAATNGLDCPNLPTTPIPILQLHGTADVLYGYNLAERFRDRMVTHWQYGAAEQIVDEPGYRAWRRMTRGTEYLFYAHDFRAESFLLGGHCFPGSPDTTVALPNQLFAYGCLGDGQFDQGRLVAQFFRDHPRQ